MGRAWIIQDDYRINKCKVVLISNQWINNTFIEAEALITLDLVTTVVRNIVTEEGGKLKLFTDCKITCDLLTLDRIKANQFALDG